MEITEKLLSILQIVNDWLKFAEAKNAVLLAFCGAAITTTITYLNAATTVPNSLKIGLLISIFLLCVSLLICSLSFLPKTDMEYFTRLRKRPNRNSQSLLKSTDNFYFFNNLRKYDSDNLLEAMNEFYFEDKLPKPYKKEDLDIASQITINSEIASTKFAFFRIALWLLILSILTIPISNLISLVIYRKL
jgi:hypothetical protein